MPKGARILSAAASEHRCFPLRWRDEFEHHHGSKAERKLRGAGGEIVTSRRSALAPLIHHDAIGEAKATIGGAWMFNPARLFDAHPPSPPPSICLAYSAPARAAPTALGVCACIPWITHAMSAACHCPSSAIARLRPSDPHREHTKWMSAVGGGQTCQSRAIAHPPRVPGALYTCDSAVKSHGGAFNIRSPSGRRIHSLRYVVAKWP
eukprot:4751246-Pleurochrysis_carterae.AAC.2